MLKKILGLFFILSFPLYAGLSNAPTRGELNSNVNITMFGDYQCPFTQRGDATINLLMKEDKDFSFSMKQYPLSFHPMARYAAKAALCAGDSGKYWEMHDLLFKSPQSKMTEASINNLAMNLDLPKEIFAECMKGQSADKTIERDIEEAKELKIQGTPYFIITGPRGTKILSGAYPRESFIEAINSVRN